MNRLTRSATRHLYQRLRHVARAAFIALCLLLPLTNASAHANLVASNPENGAVLLERPAAITLEFSEDLDPSISRVRLLNALSAQVVEGPGIIDPLNPRVLKLDLPDLPDGSYIAVWQARSAADGHVTNGSVNFSIGKSDPTISYLPVTNKDLPDRATPNAVEIILRAFGYLFAALLGGAVFFKPLVWKPAFHGGESPYGPDEAFMARLLRRQAVLAGGGLLLASVGQILYKMIEAGGGFGSFIGSATMTWHLARFMLCMAWLMLALQPNPGKGELLRDGLKAAAYLGILATFSLSSHSAAWGSPLPVVLDWLHLLGMGAWLGGLLPLFLVLRSSRVPGWKIVPYFSKVALASVTLLALTGGLNAIRAVQSWDALLSTSYGITLSIKLALFGAIFLLGAINILFISPRLKTQTAASESKLHKTVRIELLLGAVLLITVGVLTATATAYEAKQAVQRMGLVGTYTKADIAIALWVAPRQAGENEIAVDISPSLLRSVTTDNEVLLRVEMPIHKTGVTQIKMHSTSPTRFLARGSYLSMAGTWNVEVILRRPGQNDIIHEFAVDVRQNPNEPEITNPVPANARTLTAAKVDYEQFCLPCHGSTGKGDGPNALMMNPRPADLTVHGAPGVHTDGQLYLWISQGYPGSAMPAFDQYLTEEQRWSLVNYIHTLATTQ